MRTKTIAIYEFSELPEDIQAQVIENFKQDHTLCEWALEDGIRSLKAYCEHFGVTLREWSIGAYQHSYAITDAENSHFRGLKLKNCDEEYMPTGYCIDWEFFSRFYGEFKSTGNAKEAFEYGLAMGIEAIVRDAEECYSDESIIAMIEANDYEFLECGGLA